MADTPLPILLITPDYPPNTGGVARYLHTLVQVLGEDVHVVSSPAQLLYAHAKPNWLKTIVLLWRTRHTYRSVLVSHVLPMGTAAYVASWFTRKPYGVIVHGYDVSLARTRLRKRFLMRRVLRRAAAVFANSVALSEELKTLDGVARVYPLLPALLLPKLPASSIIMPCKPWNVLLSVGRLMERKGHTRVLEALARLRAEGKAREVTYMIVGEGPWRAVIEEHIERLGLSDCVLLYGRVADEDMPRLYEEADVFVLPTVVDAIDREGFGYVYIEAALYGVPSVATQSFGVEEAVLHGKTGVLIEDGNIDQLAQTLHLLLIERDYRLALGRAAKERVYKEFDAQTRFIEVKKHL